MFRELQTYLQEYNGKDSLIRLQSFLTLLFAFGVIIYQIINNKIFIDLDILLITAAFVPKSLQKFAELAKPDLKKRNESSTNRIED